MLIGNGLVASAFGGYVDRQDVTIFAAGVSNARETSPAAFAREANLLDAALRDTSRVFVYFGTCSQFDPTAIGTPYVRHKLAMEAKVRSSGRKWRVFRLPQVVGQSTNPDTLVNYLMRKLVEGAQFEVWARATRALIAPADVARAADHLLQNGESDHAVNFWTVPTTPLDIVRALETILGVKGRYTVTDRGEPFAVDGAAFTAACAATGIDLDAGYTERVLRQAYER